MAEPRDYGRTIAVAFLAVIVPVVIGFTIDWTLAASFRPYVKPFFVGTGGAL